MSNTLQTMEDFFSDKRILVTGGTGSIGEKIVASLLVFNPKEVIVFNRDDTKQYIMKKKYPNYSNLSFYLGDIRDYFSVEYITRGVDYVFHTAALKQVPICEEFPIEAVMTNVYGSNNLIQACISNNVKKVINVSTDKAVNPQNVMGITKYLSEKIFKQANCLKNNTGTKFSSVRFGNVVGSRGSVIPVFFEQIKLGKDLTLTNPNMTRFIMTISDAVKLTLKAMYYANGGEIFILKMKAINLSDLISAIKIYIKGKGLEEPKIEVIGLQPGEKLHEELLLKDENNNIFEDEELYVLLPSSKVTHYWHFKKSLIIDYCSNQAKKITVEEIVSLIKQLDLGFN